MKVIMTGGGTGGHIYPAIAIADEFKKRYPDTEILFVGAERGLEKVLVPERGYDIKLITVAGIDRKNPLKNIDVPRKLAKGSRQAKNILREFQPDFVIGTGGYASAPVVKMAQKLGIPTYIHEQNAYPGVTNKMLEKHVRKVFLGFEQASEYFRDPSKQVYAGNPVREEFLVSDREEARKKLGYDEDDFVILSFGGSQGAGRINKAMLRVIKEFNGAEGVRVCLATGSYYYDAILHALGEEGVETADNIEIKEFIHDMADRLAASDLVISRAGALTVAEVTVSGAPTIFIPSPIVAGNHQYHNAMAICREGGAFLIEEKDLENEKLIEKIKNLMDNRDVLRDMSEKSRACGRRHATELICDTVLEDCGNAQ